jgi:hypothetical protein
MNDSPEQERPPITMEWTEDFPEGSIDWDFGVDFSAASLDKLSAATNRSRSQIVEDFRDYLAGHGPDAIADLMWEWRQALLGGAGVPCAVCGREYATATARSPMRADK